MIKGNVKVKNKVSGKLNNTTVKMYPTLENLTVIPSKERQTFVHKDTYGYDVVEVDPVVLQNKTVVATDEQQVISADDEYFGLDQVIVEPIQPMPIKPQFISFSACPLSNIDETLRSIDTSELTSMKQLFYMSSLTSIDLSNFNTSNVVNFDATFSHSSLLTSLDVSHLNVSNANYFGSMFSGLSKITQLNLSNFVAPKVVNTTYMFNSCTNLQRVDLSNLTFENVTNMQSMFYDCKKLMYIDLRSADFSKVTKSTQAFYNVPLNCEIIVKDQKAKDFILSVRSGFSNIKLVSEL